MGKSTQVPGNWTSVSTYFECPFVSWGLFLFNLLEVVLSTGEESLAEARRSQVEECVLFAVGKEAWGFQLYFLAPAHRHCLWKRAAETCCFIPASSWSRPFPARLDLIFSQGCPLVDQAESSLLPLPHILVGVVRHLALSPRISASSYQSFQGQDLLFVPPPITVHHP